MILEQLKTLGKEMGETLSSSAFSKAQRLWLSLPKEEKQEAQTTFYKAAEDAYKQRT